MSLKYCGRKVYDKRNGQICRPQKCRVKFGKTVFLDQFDAKIFYLDHLQLSQMGKQPF